MSGEGAADALHALCLSDPVWAERYEGWMELGRGASATVVRTHSRISGEDVALKVFLRVEADDWQRFQAEVRNAQALASPFIVRTYSPFRRGPIVWIEMELVDGPDLKRELERRAPTGARFTVPEALEVGASVARALVAGHEAGVVHRDVKPANVLLPRSGRPAAKLGDFGTSRLTGAARITHTGLLAGTPQFASPEIIAGGGAGPASDVYSLMLCVYLMLSGNRFPFAIDEDAPVTQWLKAHAEAPARPVTSFNRDVPAWLTDLVARGLAKDPSRRPSAIEVAAAFEGAGTSAAILAGRRSKPPVGIAAGVAVLSLAAAAVALRKPKEPAAVAPAPVASAAAPRASGGEAPTPRPVPKETRRGTPLLPSQANRAPSEFGLRASLRGEVLTLANSGSRRLEGLRVVVVDSAGGRHDAAAEAIAAGEELYLALDEFQPPLDAALAPSRVEVTACDERGGSHAFPLSLR